MKLIMYISCLILMKFVYISSNPNVSLGYTFTLAIPSEYSEGFNGKAYIMLETDHVITMPTMNFRTAMSIEAINGRYACSLDVYFGDVKVWSSGHFSKFFTSDICVLEFSNLGDLQLKGENDEVGWRTGTSGQGVQELKLLDTGNLVLVDPQENIKWQTFNFPTNILLLGQGLSVATHLTSFPTTNNHSNNHTSAFFSFEINHDKVVLYLNLVPNNASNTNNKSNNSNNKNNNKYSYWEFQPSGINNITYIELATRGLELFDEKFENLSRIIPPHKQPISFLALDKETGNLGFYYYSPNKHKFEASFQVLNTTCDLPLACPSYGICTFSNSCSCIRFPTTRDDDDGCDEAIHTPSSSSSSSPPSSSEDEVETIMLELEDATSSLLKNDDDDDASLMSNVSKEKCANSCLNDWECNAALYSMNTRECMFYGVVRGVKQVNRGSGLSYLVKVSKASFGKHKKSGLRKWVLILILVADGVVLFLVAGGLGFFILWKRKNKFRDGNCSS